MLTSKGVGFYSYMIAMVFADTRENVDEVMSPRFIFVSSKTPKNMEKLIVLYGEQNAGKTTTLRKLFELLTGYKLKSKDPKGDFRVVFPVGKKTIFLSSFGDSKGVIDTNFDFFNLSMHGKTIIYDLSSGDKLKRIDKQCVQSNKPDICISACRIYKDGRPNDIFDEVNKRIMECMPIKNGIQWVAKARSLASGVKRKTDNSDYETALALASEILKDNII